MNKIIENYKEIAEKYKDLDLRMSHSDADKLYNELSNFKLSLSCEEINNFISSDIKPVEYSNFEDSFGLFVSSLINNSVENEFCLDFTFFSKKINYLGFKLRKSKIVNIKGEVGLDIGEKNMGKIILEKCGDSAGRDNKGYIEIGECGDNLGSLNYGKIVVTKCGNELGFGNAGEIIVDKAQDYIGWENVGKIKIKKCGDDIGNANVGEIWIDESYKSLSENLSSGTIYFKDRKIVDKGKLL